MARTRQIQTSFASGVLAPDLGLRRDTQQYANGAKRLRNCRLLVGGGFTRRPGTRWLSTLAGAGRLVEFIVSSSVRYLLVFRPGAMEAYLPDGTPAGMLTGCPWTGDIWSEFGWVQQADTMFIAHPTMPVQVLTRTGPADWSVRPFSFYTQPGGATRQPYYKVAPRAMTLQPTGLSGSVTLVTSSPWWTGAHVGQRVRYAGREARITAVVSGTQATALVVEELPQTTDLIMEDATGFRVGDVVEGDKSTAKGKVVAVSNATVTVLQSSRQNAFAADEKLVGPTAVAKIISAAAAAAPAATTDWDEALIGPVHGYPACVELHRNRLCFAGCPAAPSALLASRIDSFDDFDVGTGGDADAIFAIIGDGAAAEIRHLISTEQLLVLTDAGPYYVPESAQSPFRPSSVAFLRFGSDWPVSPTCRPHIFDDGVAMVTGSLVVMLRPTGNSSNRQWEAEEVSLLSSHLLSAPVDAAVTSNFAGGPERYAVFLNVDGTLAVMMLVQAQDIRSFSPWDTAGTILSVAAMSGDIYAIVRRQINGATVHVLERFEDGLTLDAATTYDADLSAAPVRYGATTVNVLASTYHLGTWPVAVDLPAGPYVVGLNYTVVAETLVPYLQGVPAGGAGRPMRIVEANVHVLTSARFTLNGLTLTAYQLADAIDQPPPLRDGALTFKLMGWRRDPTFTITQSDPLPITVLGISMEVSF